MAIDNSILRRFHFLRAHRRCVAFGSILAVSAFLAMQPVAATAADDWPMFGHDLQNTAKGGKGPRPDVGQLAPKWVFTTGGDVSARAAVVKNVAYFPDWGGNLWAVDARTGTKIWGHELSDYGLPANTISTTSPAVAGSTLYIGTQEGAWLLAINAANGDLLWKTQLESLANDPFATIAASPAVSGGVVYTGVTSTEDDVAADPNYPCCKARGSVVAVDAATGAIKWKTYTVPAGYSGGGVSGSNFVVDTTRGTLFVSTGNNFSQPTDPAYLACIAAGGTAANCSSPANHVDSILALDLATGAIKWASKLVTWTQPGVTDGSDDWNLACLSFPPGQGNCPIGAGPGYGFASAPNLITYQASKVATRSSGLDRRVASTTPSIRTPAQCCGARRSAQARILGGMAVGSATDGDRIYVSIANLYGIPTPVGSAGSWAALAPETGAIVWQTGDPNGAIALGPLAVADGVVYASSMAGGATAPTMLALKANTGQILWSFAAGSSVNAGATIADGVVYWGSGYAFLGIPGFTGNNKFFAFSKGGK